MTRTRFAPSPTGDLHIGSVRTALYCWLYARHTDGKYILRIEDTDRERSTQSSIDVILNGLKWLGLDQDEGPIYQTDRFERYQAVVEQLLAEKTAYRCTCTKERLEQLREAQMAAKQKPRYDGHCRDKDLPATIDEAFVIRFRNPQEGVVQFDDAVRGMVTVQNSELDDLIIARTDGTPTYNFTVVVDDWDMNMTDVIRGDDHINNTPRQINIFLALGAPIPRYAHVPMILGSDGKRLSKRHGAVSVLTYRDEGYLPHAILNYLVRLGWSHGDQEIFSIDEMIKYFDLSGLNRAAATFNTEKLLWLNQHYLKSLSAAEVAEHLAWHMAQQGISTNHGPALSSIVTMQAERCKTLAEMADSSRYFYEEVTEYNEKAAKKNLNQDSLIVLQTLRDNFFLLDDWHKEPLHEAVIAVGEKLDLKLGKVAQPLRVALTGDTISPSIDITLELIGKERVLARLDKAIAYIAERV